MKKSYFTTFSKLSFLFLLFNINVYMQAQNCNDLSNFKFACIGTTQTFEAGVDAAPAGGGNNYGCMSTQPNAAWFYFKASSNGALNIRQTNSNNLDVDGVLWGPFNSTSDITGQCGNYPAPLACDYASAPGFNFSVNVQANQYYVLLVTNYSNRPTSILLEDNNSTAQTDCNPDIQITKTVDNTAPNVGEDFTWTVTAKNVGLSAATNLRIRDLLNSRLEFVSYTATNGTYNNGTGFWELGNFGVEQEAELKITTRVRNNNCGRTITNTISSVSVGPGLTETNEAVDDLSESITVQNNLSAGSITTATRYVCNGDIPATFTEVNPAVSSTVGATIAYQWYIRTEDGTPTTDIINGATGSEYTPTSPITNNTVYYRRAIVIYPNGYFCERSTAIRVRINEVSAGVISGDATVCAGQSITVNSSTDGVGSFPGITTQPTTTYQWQQSTDNGTSWTDVSGQTSNTLNLSNGVTQTTKFRRKTISTYSNSVCDALSNEVTITVRDVSAGEIAGNQTICPNDTPSGFTSISAGTGSPNLINVTYDWEMYDNTSSMWVSQGVSTEDYPNPPALANAGTTLVNYRFRRKLSAVFAGNGNICSPYYSNEIVVGVNPTGASPNSGIISGLDYVCINATTNYATDGASGGQWTISNAGGTSASIDINTGELTAGATAGTITIQYEVAGGTCATASTTSKTIEIEAQPSAVTLSGAASLCLDGSTTTIGSNVSGGKWSSIQPGIATVDENTGVVTGVASGTTDIVYTVTSTNGACSTTEAHSITIEEPPVAGTITGFNANQLCVSPTATGVTLGISGNSATGVWSSNNPTFAAINSSGVITTTASAVTGLTAPLDVTFTYTVVSATCGNVTVDKVITLMPQPNAGAFTLNGGNSVCVGTTVTAIRTTQNNYPGVWSSSDETVATVNNSGVVTTLKAGSVDITFTINDATPCSGNPSTTTTLTIDAEPEAGTISGNATMCPTSTQTLTLSTDADAGGSWTVTPVPVISTGNLTPTPITTNPLGCSLEALPGASGFFDVTYTVNAPSSNSCGGSDTATFRVNVLAYSAGSISQASNLTQVCSNSTIKLDINNSQGTGAWSSSDTNIANVDQNGLVTPVADQSGNVTIVYTVTSPNCAPQGTTYNLEVVKEANAGKLDVTTGNSTAICTNNIIGTSTGVTEITTDGDANGNWTIDNGAIAELITSSLSADKRTIKLRGKTGSGGLVTVTYTTPATTVCAAKSSSMIIKVVKEPIAGTLSMVPTSNPSVNTGTLMVCSNTPFALQTDGDTGGQWQSLDTNKAIIDENTGVVTPVNFQEGSVTFTYTVLGDNPPCALNDVSQITITIEKEPNAGSGANSTNGFELCAGGTTTLTPIGADSGTSYTTGWISSNPSVASIDPSTGVVTASSPTVTTAVNMTYTVTDNDNLCTNVSSTNVVTITVYPPTTINGGSEVCTGETLLLAGSGSPSSTNPWISSTTGVATVNNSGLVTAGSVAGTTTITYTDANGCSTTKQITVNEAPQITGGNSVCVGKELQLTGIGTPATSNAWSSDNLAVATVDNTGLVTAGTTTGTVNITFTNDNGCSISQSVNVLPVPNTPNANPQVFCGSAQVSNLVATGATGNTINWYLSNSTSATPLPSNQTLANGTYYVSQTNGNNCESDRLPVSVTVNPIPNQPNVTAPTPFCSNTNPTVSNLIPLATANSGGTLQWYTTSVNGTPLASTSNLTTATYYVGETVNGCESTRVPVQVTVNDCTDSDGDGVYDTVDLDDDNDGITDTDEGCASGSLIWANEFTAGGTGYTSGPDINTNPTINLGTTTYSYTRNIVGTISNQEYHINSSINSIVGFSLSQGNTANTAANYSEHTFAFSNAVANLSFSVYDLDSNTSGQGESLTFIITDENNNSYTLLPSNYTIDGHVVSGNLISGLTATNEKYLSINLGNVLVSSITIQYRVPGTSGRGQIKISDLTFNTAKDSDGDGIFDCLDLDSDNDGCVDALENGSTTITSADLVNASGTVTVGSSTASNQNLKLPVGTSGTTQGIPTIAGSGQGVGSSITSAVLAITTQPIDQNVCATKNVTFTSTPTVTGASLSTTNLTYQWEVSTDNGANWNNATVGTNSGTVASGNAVNLTFTTNDLQNGHQYRIVYSHPDNSCGITSNAATLNVTATPIQPTPVSPRVFCITDNAQVSSLTATANSGGVLQWYLASTGGSVLSNTEALSTGTYYVGETVNGCESTRVPVQVTVNDCTDSDGDGVYDSVDLDDDNDGILDTDEYVTGCQNTADGNLNYEFYDGTPSSNTVDNIPTSGGVTGQVSDFNVTTLRGTAQPTGTDDTFAIRYTGFIFINTSETYTFYTRSDDGSKLFINGVEIVNNDGLHGTVERQGNITLTPGAYPIKVEFFENTGSQNLTVSYSSTSISKRAIPFAVLSSTYTSCNKDTDGDGIFDHLDLDSDNDGCVDALEGASTTITSANLITASGTVTVGSSIASNQNLGTTVGTSGATQGVPTIAGTGQAVGSSIVSAVLAVTTQPADASVCTTKDITFSATPTVTGTSLSTTNIDYQWLVSTDNGSTWNNVTVGTPSGTVVSGSSAELTFTADASMNNNQYKVAFSHTDNSCGLESNIAMLTVENTPVPPTVTSPQVFCSSDNPQVASLIATANSGGTLQWYTTSTGGTALVSTEPLNSGTYYVGETLNSCESTRVAVEVTVNDCTDSDGDGVYDSVDLDDDNDGILDADECNSSTVKFLQSSIETIPTGGTTSHTVTFENGRTVQVSSTDEFYRNSDINVTQTYPYSVVYPNTVSNSIITISLQFSTPTKNFSLILDDFDGGAFERAYDFSVIPTSVSTNTVNIGTATNPSYQSNNRNQHIYLNYDLGTAITNLTFTVNSAGQGYGFNIELNDCQDSDNDGIFDYLDLDSDNDGCVDALEGANTTITSANLVTASGTVNVGTSTASNQNLGNTVNASGVPTIVGTGQAVGSSIVSAVLAVTTQPADASVCTTKDVTLSVTPTVTGGSTTNIDYQWLVSTDNGATWNNVIVGTPSGTVVSGSPAELTFTVDASMNDNQYKVAFSHTDNSCGLESNVATLTVENTPVPPTVTSPQVFCSSDNPQVANLTATANSSGTLQWYTTITGGSALTSTVTLNTATYYVGETVNGCESVRVPVQVTVNDCTDSDGDGIYDTVDLDDDNDGITDIDEGCNSGSLIWANHFTAGSGSFTAGPDVNTNPNINLGVTNYTYSRNIVGTVNNGNYRINSYGNSTIGFSLTQDRSDINSYSEHTFQFSTPVANLSFSVFDLDDTSGGGGNESLTFTITDADNNTYTLLASNYVLDNHIVTGNVITGTLASNNKYLTIDLGNVLVSSISFQYRAVGATAPAFIKISNLTFDIAKDTDGDGIFDCLDLDSDNDGCVDALEGGSTTITSANLVTASGTVNVGSSTASNQNLGNTVGTSGTVQGIPTIIGSGQAVGSSIVSAVLAVTTQPADASVCTTKDVTFSATPTVTGGSTTNIDYQWLVSTNNGATWNNVTVGTPSGTVVSGSPAELTFTVDASMNDNQYKVAFSHPDNSCGIESGVAMLTVETTPIPPRVESPQVFCSSDNPQVANLTATANSSGTLQWYTASTGGTALPSTTTLINQSYFVGETVNGCESERVEVVVTVNTTPNAPTANAQEFCASSNSTVANLVITSTAVGTVNWYASQTATTALDPTTVLTTQTYYVADSDNSCESTRTPVVVTIHDNPTISGDSSVCLGNTLQLTGSGTPAITNPWVSSNTAVASVSSSGLVTAGTTSGTTTITYTDANGCTITKDITVNDNPTITGTLTVCEGLTTQLTGSGTASTSNAWMSSNLAVATVSQTGLVTASSVGTTDITYTDANGCSVTETVTVNDTPDALVATAQSFCSSDGATVADLVPAPSTTVQWFINGTINTPLASSDALLVGTNTYYVSEVTTSGCEGPRTSVVVTITQTPSVPSGVVTVQPTCSVPSGTIEINAQTGVEYSINNTNWQTNNTFTGVAPGDYTLYVRSTSDNTCSSSSASQVTVNPVPSAPSTPVASVTVQPTCSVPTGTIVFTAQSDVEYSINGMDYQANNEFTGVVPGTYTLYVRSTTDNTCVTDSGSTQVTVNPVPATPSLPVGSVTTQPTCSVPSGTIEVTSPSTGVEYSIDGTAYQASNTFTGVAPGAYTLYVRSTTDNSCISSSTATVTVNPIPVAPTVPAGVVTTQPTCSLPSGTIEINSQSDVEYSINNTNWQTSNTFTGVAPGDYTLYARSTSDNTCSSSSASQVTVNPVPSAPSTPVASVTVQPTCSVSTGTIVFTAQTDVEYSINGMDYQANNEFTGVVPGTYTLYVRSTTDNTCVTDSGSTQVTVNPVPATPSLPVGSVTAQPTCAVPSGTIEVTSPSTGVEYSIDGTAYQASNTFTGVAPGAYTLYVRSTTDSSCISSSTDTVTVNPIPVAPTVPLGVVTSQPTCSVPSGTIEINAQTDVEYSINNTNWQTSNTFTGVAPGAYTLYVRSTSDTTCSSSSVSQVTVNPQPSTPTPPTVTDTTQSFCSADNAMVSSLVPAPSTTVKWYETETGGTSLEPTDILASGTYYVANQSNEGCESDKVAVTIVIVPAPNAGAIEGGSTVCTDSTLILTNPTGDAGVWSVDSANGTIDTNGVYTPSSTVNGNVEISYTVSALSPCTTEAVVTKIVTVTPAANAGTVSIQTTPICSGTSVTASSTGDSGGVWSSTNEAVAIVDSVSGLVTGVSTGTATIVYTVGGTGACSSNASQVITVGVVSTPNAGEIQGGDAVCNDSSIVFTNPTADSGVWSVPTAEGTITNDGIYTPSATASEFVTITYTVAAQTPCATDAVVTKIVRVTKAPNAGTITGNTEICFIETTALSSDGDANGIWSSSNPAIATVSSTGIVSGVSAGNVTIFYTVEATSPCNSDSVQRIDVTITDDCYVDLGITKTIDEPNARANQEVTFTITVTNLNLSSVATNVVVSDVLPDGYEYVTHDASVGNYDRVTGIWNIEQIDNSTLDSNGDIDYSRVILEVTVNVNETGDYTNTASITSSDQPDNNLKNNTASVSIEPKCLTVFNELTPNGDGKNDYFEIDCIDNYPNNNLLIYNRWGNVVYEKKGYTSTTRWEGTSNGRANISVDDKLPTGTYFYVLDLGDGSPVLKGWLYISSKK